MPAEIPQGELSRTVTHEPDSTYPDLVEIRLIWNVKGQQRIRTQEISSAEFFGHGRFGAPIPAESIVQGIERMRRQGPPEAKQRRKR
jgi:hypothetical protein